MTSRKTRCAVHDIVDPLPSVGPPHECCACWLGESQRMLSLVAQRLAIRVFGRQSQREMLHDYVCGVGPRSDDALLRGLSEHHLSRDRDRLAYELSGALRDVAELLSSDLARHFVRSARDIDMMAEEGQADHALASWITRLQRAGVSDEDFLRLPT